MQRSLESISTALCMWECDFTVGESTKSWFHEICKQQAVAEFHDTSEENRPFPASMWVLSREHEHTQRPVCSQGCLQTRGNCEYDFLDLVTFERG